jgi:DNA invertase Pin-like site-specific DNA recombinase
VAYHQSQSRTASARGNSAGWDWEGESRLAPYQQREAKERRAAGESARAIARSYGVDRRTIERIQA